MTVYRGYNLERARMGHINVGTADGFVGGYPSMAAARARVDEIVDRPVVRRARLSDGRIGARICPVNLPMHGPARADLAKAAQEEI